MKRRSKVCVGVVLLALALIGGMRIPAAGAGRPEFLMMFQSDPFRTAEVDGCSVCHDDPNGGGPRNVFGRAFEEAGYRITPMMRADFPDRFTIEAAELASGTVFYFADPDDRFVVVEMAEERHLLDLEAVAAGSVSAPPNRGNAMSFFVTSVGMGDGGNLGGLAGADRHCGALAEAAGAGDRTWRAYLSTSFDGDPVVNAGDRIGNGPWYNAGGILIAGGVSDLHAGQSRLGRATALDENGEVVPGIDDDPNRHDILTGSTPEGTAAVGRNCNNWTSSSEGTAMVGHHDRLGGGGAERSWNSVHPTRGCGQTDLEATGGAGLFYCFAID
jgi:hypothetical protein